MDNKHIYHFHAISQDGETGSTIHIDGIFKSKDFIENMHDYEKLKKEIITDNELALKEIVITSLSILNI